MKIITCAALITSVLPCAYAISGCTTDNTNNNTTSGDSGTELDSSQAVLDSAGADALADSTSPSDGRSEGATDGMAEATADAAADGEPDGMVGADASGDGEADGDSGDGALAAAANAVYTMSNVQGGNTVLGFLRGAGGTLTPMASPFSTGGHGSGAALGAQGALAYDRPTNRVYAVNAGDGSFSILPVNADGTLGAAIVVSPGSTSLVGPKSIAVFGDTVYVLYEGNGTTASMIAGYSVSGAGVAISGTPITGSTLTLSSAAQSVDPAQIAFTPDGQWLVVTEKQSGAGGSLSGAGSIDTFGVNSAGLASKHGFYPMASAGVDAGVQMTPYGFAFVGSTLVVSEAGSTGVGSYTYAAGVIAPTSPSSGSQFLPSDPAPCWVASAADWAYVANARGPDVSGYTVTLSGGLVNIGAQPNAVLALTGQTLTSDAGTTILGPTDESVSADGKFLYVLDSAVPAIGIFAISAVDGTLTRVGSSDFTPSVAGALPAGAVGIVAR